MVARCEQSRNSTPLPLVGSLAGYPFPMGTVREHRRAWFLHLLAEAERKHGRRGAKRRLAEKIGTAPSVVSQVASGTRQVGDELARRIEQKHGLQRGQVDGPLDPSTLPTKPASESLDADLLQHLLGELEAALEAADVDLRLPAKARVLSELYGLYAGTGERPGRAVILQFARRT